MLRVGLTGGLASGKSMVGTMMTARGAHLVQADAIAHQLMRPGQPVYEEVVRHFGREIVHSNGEIHRARLAEAAFGGGRVRELNQIVHPAVIARQQQWMEEVGRNNPDAVVVVEAALILEAGANGRFDKLVVVTCKPEQKVERFVSRLREAAADPGKFDEAGARTEAQRRIAAQLPDEEKLRAADFLIDNSGTREHTEQQVARLMTQLKALASGKNSAAINRGEQAT